MTTLMVTLQYFSQQKKYTHPFGLAGAEKPSKGPSPFWIADFPWSTHDFRCHHLVPGDSCRGTTLLLWAWWFWNPEIWGVLPCQRKQWSLYDTNPNNALLISGNPSEGPFLVFDSSKMGWPLENGMADCLKGMFWETNGLASPKKKVSLKNKKLLKIGKKMGSLPWTQLKFRHQKSGFLQISWPKLSKIGILSNRVALFVGSLR